MPSEVIETSFQSESVNAFGQQQLPFLTQNSSLFISSQPQHNRCCRPATDKELARRCPRQRKHRRRSASVRLNRERSLFSQRNKRQPLIPDRRPTADTFALSH